MEKDAQARISPLQLRIARKHAQRLLAHNGLEDDALESLVTYYTAATKDGVPAVDALEISSGLARNGHAPADVQAYTLDEFLDGLDKKHIGESIAGLNAFLRTREQEPMPVYFDNQFYQRNPVREEVQLVGLEKQYALVEEQVKKLLCYNPRSRSNFRRKKDDSAVLLYGPPGTGKSSLCIHASSLAQRLSSVSGLPLREESFRTTDFSKWVGESSQNFQKKFDNLSDPSGIGLLILEEVDMLFDDRKSSYSNGSQHVTSTLMQNLSGVDENPYNNVLVIGTTNMPDKIDYGVSRRFTQQIEVPGFSEKRQYQSLAAHVLTWADEPVHSYLAQTAFEKKLSPASTKALLNYVDDVRMGPIDEKVFELPLEQREKYLRSRYSEMDVSDVKKALDDYSF